MSQKEECDSPLPTLFHCAVNKIPQNNRTLHPTFQRHTSTFTEYFYSIDCPFCRLSVFISKDEEVQKLTGSLHETEH